MMRLFFIPSLGVVFQKASAHASTLLLLILLSGCTQALNVKNSVVSLAPLALAVKGAGAATRISYNVKNARNPIENLKLEYTTDDGATWNLIAEPSVNSSYYDWVPASDYPAVRIRMTAKDRTKIYVLESSNFAVDSIAPSTPTFTRTSAALTNSRTVTGTLTSCADTAGIFISESNSAPSENAAGWQTCSTTASATTFTTSSGDGAKTIYAFAKDLAGNISPVSSSVTMTLDQTPPAAPSVVLHSPSYTPFTAIAITSSTCVDMPSLMVTESAAIPAAGAAAWQACNTTAGGITHTLSNSTLGAHPLYVWSKDALGNVSVSSTNFGVVFDNQVPVLQSVIINNSDTYTLSPFINVKIAIQKTLATPVEVHLGEADLITGECDSEYANDTIWSAWFSSSQSFAFSFSSSDGVKKLCVWARDAAGNESVQANPQGVAAVSTDSIQYLVSSPPVIGSLSVYNPFDASHVYTLAHRNMNVDWSASSSIGLPANPIAISYTTDGILYKDIVSDLDVTILANVTWLGSITTGVTSASGSYTPFQAPTGLFRIRTVVKDIAGNIGVPVVSDLQNGGQWSIYAGTTDRGVGGSGRSALMTGPQSGAKYYAVNPTNNDIYALDVNRGIRKLDAQTGVVSTFIADGSDDLLSNGATLPASPHFSMAAMNLAFDSNGLLYLNALTGYTSSVYQINPTTRAVKHYLPGGTAIGSAASPPPAASVNVLPGPVIFDESNSLYFLMNCHPNTHAGSGMGGDGTYVIAKVTQDPTTHEAGAVSYVAGNCGAFATPAWGTVATASVLPELVYTSIATMTTWQNGKYLYFNSYSGTSYKILDGKIYSSAVGGDGQAYQASTGKVIVSAGTVYLMTPELTGNGGETLTPLIASSNSGNCTADGIDKNAACLNSYAPVSFNQQGVAMIAEGNSLNAYTPYRIRYVDSQDKVKTLFGTLPFYGEGLSGSLARGTFGGIFYKNTSLGTAGNLTAFPEGLYFVEKGGQIFGRFHPTTKNTSIIWGNQSNLGFSSGVVDNTVSMGSPYYFRNARIMNFDSTGLPWLAAGVNLYSFAVSGSDKIITPRTGTAFYYYNAADGSNISDVALGVQGYENNFQIGSNGLAFMAGSYYLPGAVIKILNYSASTVGAIPAGKLYNIMGLSSAAGIALDSSADAPPNSVAVKDKTLWDGCTMDGACMTVYREDENRLYFAEYDAIRYITTVDTPSTSTLATLFHHSGIIDNFTFSPDHKTLYYISNSRLYCRNLTSTRDECVTTGELGPPSGTDLIYKGPNQLTWKDNATLLISNYVGTIYQYNVPVDPTP